MVPTSNNAMTWQWVQEVAMHRASLMQVLLFHLDLAEWVLLTQCSFVAVH
jgi:hypothetical protein